MLSMQTDAAENEQQISFPGQYPGEKVILIKRRDPATLLGFAIYIITMFLLPIISYVFLSSYLVDDLFALFLFVTGIYLMLFWLIIFAVTVNYYLDIWIITNQRIIAVEQNGFFNRIITEVRYDRIQDITSEVSGLFATYFKYGDVLIQTAGERERMVLKSIPDPIETRRIIAEIYKKTVEQIENLENKPPITI